MNGKGIVGRTYLPSVLEVVVASTSDVSGLTAIRYTPGMHYSFSSKMVTESGRV